MDFAQLVAKMNEIEKNEEPKVIQETGEMKTEVGATKDLLSKFNEIQDANPYEPVVAEAKVKEEEVEEKPKVTRSPGGKTFRRKKETEMAESMTPADAILLSSPVQPDLDRALMVVKGIA